MDVNLCNSVLGHRFNVMLYRLLYFERKRDKSVLLVALAEIIHMADIPYAVSINEAANIASKYSSEKSASFVSGILSEVKNNDSCN